MEHSSQSWDSTLFSINPLNLNEKLENVRRRNLWHLGVYKGVSPHSRKKRFSSFNTYPTTQQVHLPNTLQLLNTLQYAAQIQQVTTPSTCKMASSNSGTSSAQGLFETEMAHAYSPNSQFSRKQWDPVLCTWRLSKAVQLFPPRHASKADAIFGEGAANEIYSPHNGLFLHEMVEHALKKGYIAIIPNGPSEFKVVVLDKYRREVNRRIARFEVDGFCRYIDLDERQLIFKTDVRPKMRYVWWTYVNAVLQAFYFADCASDYGKIDHRSEVRWFDSCWTHHGPFAKRNQLKWFVKDSCGPCWTAAFLHGFQEEGDTLNVKRDLEHIFTHDYYQRQRSPVADYEEIAPSDDEDTEERGHNGEVISGGNNTVVRLTRATTNLQLHGDPNRPSLPSSSSLYPPRAFVPPPPYPSATAPFYPSAPPPS